MFMAIALPTPDLAHTFSGLIDELCRTVAARSAADRGAGPMLILIFGRLRRLAARFASLAARVEAGMIQAGPPRPGRAAASANQRAGRKARLPQSFAWLIRLVPGTAAYAGQVQTLLADPQTAALVAAAPAAGRILRPLCRMLAVPLPDYLRLPRPRPGSPPTGAGSADTAAKSRPARSPRRPAPHPGPLPEGEGAELPLPPGEGRGEGPTYRAAATARPPDSR